MRVKGEESPQKMARTRQQDKPKRPMLREELAQLDNKLLRLIHRRAKLGRFKKSGSAEIVRLAVEAGCAPDLCGRFFELLEDFSFSDETDDVFSKREADGDGRQEELNGEIMRALARRQRQLGKLSSRGYISVEDEKYLRENWHRSVNELGGDAILATPIFLCLQGLKDDRGGKLKQEPFTLYSIKKTVDLHLSAPLDNLESRKWLWLAACAGQPIELNPVLHNEKLADFLGILSQLGTHAEKEGDKTRLECQAPLAYPDKIVHAGGDAFNLYLLICHYLGVYSRLKITGDTCLQLADLSFLKRVLPLLGARPVQMVPKSAGLPLRIECSGILSPAFTAEADLPDAFVEALLLCAPFYKQPFAVDLSKLANAEKLIENARPLLEQAGASFSVAAQTINFTPAPLAVPFSPKLHIDMELALFLLAISDACSGLVEISGIMPANAGIVFAFFKNCGLRWSIEAGGARSFSKKPLNFFDGRKFDAQKEAAINGRMVPLCACLGVIAAYNGGKAYLPVNVLELALDTGFFKACGVARDESGALVSLKEREENNSGWIAPDARWAMALGIAALCGSRRGKLKLANPSIMRTFWSGFWPFLNQLTSPPRPETDNAPPEERKSRRIRTQVNAVLPEIREDEDER